MTNQTDVTLQQRCAEIVEWQRTGVLPGTALREYAAEHWDGHHDDLQMAERDTSARAMELIAKLGPPQAVREPQQFLALKFHARRDKKATVTLLFDSPETADAWVVGITKGVPSEG